jgi:F0F1-type ATP synthase epsilon subunit
MIGRLGYGIMEIRQSGQTKSYYVDGGFVQVTGDTVAVLTDKLQPPNSFTVADADEELRDALALPAGQPALAAIKDKAVVRARARKQVASNS